MKIYTYFRETGYYVCTTIISACNVTTSSSATINSDLDADILGHMEVDEDFEVRKERLNSS